MNYKKFSDLDSVDNISDNDLFAVASAKDDNGNFESNKVTFSQLRDQLDYDFDVVEVLEVVPPPEDDDTVYVMINGYRVAATRAKEEVRAVYPTKVPRIVPVVSGFRAARGKLYTIPFVANSMTLSNLTVKADTNYLNLLQVIKIDDTTGIINVVSNRNSDEEYSSIITLTDEASGISTSITLYHARVVKGLSNTSATVSGNVITASWQTEISSNSNNNYHVIEPKFTLSEDIKFKALYESDYFNQAYLCKERALFVNFDVRIILEEPFTGNLAITFEDLVQGTGGMAFVNVDYRG